MPRFSTTIVCPSDPPGFLEFSSRAITDGADIDFSQPIVLGLSNPFNLTGITTAWEVKYRFDLSLSVGLTTTSSKSSGTGTSIAVSTTVLCAPFYINWKQLSVFQSL